jgi:endonuclease YncB( thermonuclease family)
LPGTAIPHSIGFVQMRNLLSFVSALILAALLAPSAMGGAQKQTGRVAHVADGANLDVLLDDKTRTRVQLAGIEIPGEGQAYYLRARQSLIAICGGEMATLDPAGRNRNGAVLAHVSCNGKNANVEQVRLGLARVLERQAGNPPALKAAQEEAKAARRGIWAPPAPQQR